MEDIAQKLRRDSAEETRRALSTANEEIQQLSARIAVEENFRAALEALLKLAADARKGTPI
jgi:hypothetical protein